MNHVKVKVKWSHYRPGVAQRVGRGIALHFHDRGTRRGWGVSSTTRPHFNPGKDLVPILQEAAWAPGPVWTSSKSHPDQEPVPDCPARSQSLFQLSYQALIINNIDHVMGMGSYTCIIIVYLPNGPSSPFSPSRPSRPGKPLSPFGPKRPGGPIKPGSPFKPGKPSSPGSPGLPAGPGKPCWMMEPIQVSKKFIQTTHTTFNNPASRIKRSISITSKFLCPCQGYTLPFYIFNNTSVFNHINPASWTKWSISITSKLLCPCQGYTLPFHIFNNTSMFIHINPASWTKWRISVTSKLLCPCQGYTLPFHIFNPSAWGHLNPSSYCDVGRLFYGVFKLWSKLQRKKWRNNF